MPAVLTKPCKKPHNIRARRDWTQDRTLERFLAQRPEKPTIITVNCRFTDIYRNAYKDATATHYCILVNSYPPPIKEAYAYVAKNTEAGGMIIQLTKGKANRILKLEVVLQGPDGTPTVAGREEFLIVRVVK